MFRDWDAEHVQLWSVPEWELHKFCLRMYGILHYNLLSVSCRWALPALQLSIHNFGISWFNRTTMGRYFRCSEIVSSDLKNVRLVKEVDADSHIISRSLVDSRASCTMWQHVVCSFIKKRTFPWNIVFPVRKGDKAECSPVTTGILS